MGFLDKIFKKKEDVKSPKGFNSLRVKEVVKVTTDSVKVVFDIPSELNNQYVFIPGQYVTLSIIIDGKEERRSYSICSGPQEALAVAIKIVPNGKVSTWANQKLKVGDLVFVSKPEGNFNWNTKDAFIVAFAAGSGVTPMLSIAKHLESQIGDMRLFYGNKSESSTMFLSDLNKLKNTKTQLFLSQEIKEGTVNSRLNKDAIGELIKSDLNLLKADAYFLCGPEEMIKSGLETLKLFGVSKEKIHYELFTTPVLLLEKEKEVTEVFKGTSQVTVFLDQEKIEFTMDENSNSVIDSLNREGYDPPYSCRGGVCSACQAKVIEGKVTMKMNYSLTEQDLENGYVLTCQAQPASEKVTISYDA
jgi:ring-1,2-phenylacetyl-CoA epoxidase subunit PaaE